jgi:hypothetical protein
MKISPTKVLAFALPTAILSALSVTNLIANPLFFSEIPLGSYNSFFPLPILLPGLFFGVGMYFYLKKEKSSLAWYKFIPQSMIIYFLAYSAGYAGGLNSMGLLATFFAVLAGTPMILFRIFRQINNDRPATGKLKEEIVRLSWILAIIFGIAGVFAAPYLESLLESLVYYTPLDISSYTSFGLMGDDVFGSGLAGTQILVFFWQIIVFFWVANKITESKETGSLV